MIRHTLAHLRTAWGSVVADVRRDEQGDVPGWVLITLVTVS